MTESPRMIAYLDMFAAAVARRGTAAAVADEKQRLTYRDLNARARARAATLRSGGVRSSDRVAIVADNSADYLVSVLALWMADAVPVTIYPSTPRADLARTLCDADPVLVLVDGASEPVVAAVSGAIPVVRIDGAFDVEQVADAEPTPADLRDQLSLICYSSGTTSRPKAIMLSAVAIANTVRTFGDVWRLSDDDVTLVSLPMAWLFGLTTSSFTTLATGGLVVSRRRAKPELLAGVIASEKVTFLPAVTTLLAKLATYLDAADGVGDIRSLRLIVSGGEPRNEAAFAALERHTGRPVHDNYCASEMQPLVTYDPVVDPRPRPGSAGRLVPRSELRVVDPDGNDVAPGTAGEALSRGVGIMLGYWKDPEATAAALTEDGWYRTKDLVRVDEDGYVHVVGRLSDMIIRGGSNISPIEVEACLREHPAVVDLAVVGRPDPLYGEEVVAAVQPAEGAQIGEAELRAFAAERLAGFKVPTTVVFVDDLPYSTTGKVSRAEVKKLLVQGAPA